MKEYVEQYDARAKTANSCGPIAPRPEAWGLLGRLSKAIESLEEGIFATETRFAGVLVIPPETKCSEGVELGPSSAELAQQLASIARRVEAATDRLADIRNRSVV